MLLMLFTLVGALAAILGVAFVSAQVPKATSKALCIGFFTALLCGHLIVNSLRALFNAISARSVVLGTASGLERLLVSQDAVALIEDLSMVLEIKESLRAAAAVKLDEVVLDLRKVNGPSPQKGANDEDFVPHFNDEEKNAYTQFAEDKSSNLLGNSAIASGGHSRSPIYKTNFISRSATRLQDENLTEISQNERDHSVGKNPRRMPRGGGSSRLMRVKNDIDKRSNFTRQDEKTPDDQEIDYQDFM